MTKLDQEPRTCAKKSLNKKDSSKNKHPQAVNHAIIPKGAANGSMISKTELLKTRSQRDKTCVISPFSAISDDFSSCLNFVLTPSSLNHTGMLKKRRVQPVAPRPCRYQASKTQSRGPQARAGKSACPHAI